MDVIAPPKGIERPIRGHKGGTSHGVIAVKNLRIGRTINNVVFKLRLAKKELCATRLGNRKSAFCGAFHVNSILLRGGIERCPSAGVVHVLERSHSQKFTV